MSLKKLVPLTLLALTSAVLLLYGLENTEIPGENETTTFPAVMELDKRTYQVGDNLTLTITNTGSETIIVGEPYRLYRLENGGWEEIETGFTFTMIGWAISPGGNWTQTVPLVIRVSDGAIGKLKPLPPGRYRITKTALIEGGKCGSRSDEITLSEEFEVVG